MITSYWQAWMELAADAQQVVALRSVKLMKNTPAARRESVRMVSEKLVAAHVAGMMLATGASPDKILKHYRSKVKANRRRLSR